MRTLLLLVVCTVPAVAQQSAVKSVGNPQNSGAEIILQQPADGTVGPAKFTGEVIVGLRLAKDGTASKIRIIRRLRPDLDQKALDAVRQYKFQPPMYNGRSVSVDLIVAVKFEIH